jgi:hypothetical protein
MRRMRIPAILFIALVLPFSACSCDEEPGANGDAGVPGGGDGTTGGGDGTTGNDGSDDNDGSTDNDGSDDNDGSGGGDGEVDAGNPLEEPLSEFCRGQGTVVTVGGTGECAGDIAEETFQFALCTCDTAEVQSNLELDAFDSRLGTYGATIAGGGVNISNDGHLGVNGALDMEGKLTVRGAAYIGGGGFNVGAQSLVVSTIYAAGDAVQENSETALGRNAYFNGNVVGRYAIAGDLHVPPTATVSMTTASMVGGVIVREAIPSLLPCPCGEDEILKVEDITAFGAMNNDNLARAGTSSLAFTLTSTAYEEGGPAVLSLPCGRYYLTRINQPAGLTIIAEGRTVLFVDGDMLIGGNFTLELLEGAEADIFVRGSLAVGSAARFGDPDAPSKVRTYVGGAGTITLSASAIFGGNLYAPRAEVIFDASSNLYGAVFARRARFDGSANIHFDSAIRGAGASCEQPDGGPGDNDGGPGNGDAGDAGIDTPNDGGPGNGDGGPGDGDGSPGNGDGGPGNGDGGPDAGGDPPAMCDGCGQCGDLACLIPDGMTEGMCGPCSDDLDCCAPYVCIGGFCTINI